MKAINLIAPFERFADRTLERVPGRRLYPAPPGALVLLAFDFIILLLFLRRRRAKLAKPEAVPAA